MFNKRVLVTAPTSAEAQIPKRPKIETTGVAFANSAPLDEDPEDQYSDEGYSDEDDPEEGYSDEWDSPDDEDYDEDGLPGQSDEETFDIEAWSVADHPSQWTPAIDRNAITFGTWLQYCHAEINLTYQGRPMSNELFASAASNLRHVLHKIMVDCAFKVDWDRKPSRHLDFRFQDDCDMARSETTTISALQVISLLALMITKCPITELKDRLMTENIAEDIQSCLWALSRVLEFSEPKDIVARIDGNEGRGLMSRLQRLGRIMDGDDGEEIDGYVKIYRSVRKELLEARATIAQLRFQNKIKTLQESNLNRDGSAASGISDRTPRALDFDYLSKSCWHLIFLEHQKSSRKRQRRYAGDVARSCDSAFKRIMAGCGYPKYDQNKLYETITSSSQPAALLTLISGIETLRKISKSICFVNGGPIKDKLLNGRCAKHLATCLFVLARTLRIHDHKQVRAYARDGKDGGLVARIGAVARLMANYEVTGFGAVYSEMKRYT